jgi:ectoine hydroxylase-related dioxygenase (phytanoyl-CoA dioxygenase family)
LEGLINHKEIGTTTRTRTGTTGKSLYSDFYSKEDFVSVPLNKGEILVHDKNTMHYSSPNITDKYRFAITSIVKFL